MKLLALCVGGLLLAAAASAKDGQGDSRLALLHARAAALDAARKQPDNPAALSAALDRYGVAASFVGDAEGALAALDETQKGRPHGVSWVKMNALGDAHAENAIRAIVAAARDKRAVLINESHHQPMNRAFTQKLAAELRKIGYTYLACETFFEAVTAQPKYVTAAHGYYTGDPAFATFVNDAIGAGWTLVPYEHIADDAVTDRAERLRLRESNQANKLYERIFARDPKARALIHVGYGHLIKQEYGGTKVMGTYLREKLGEGATLHVDQTRFFAHPDRSRENPQYRPLLAKFASPEPFVVRRADGSIPVMSYPSGRVDMEVVFPDYGVENGRPAWLAKLAGRTPHPVPASLMPASGKRLILAHGKDHGPDAVPLDAVLVEAGKPAPPLMVPPGEVRLATEN